MTGHDSPPIGDIERVPARDLWPNEETDFTPWLANNIDYLEDEDLLGITLDVQEKEAQVGRYYADIHATDSTGETDVIIENQYHTSDYKHLGKSQVYAAGFDADIIVWIAEEFDDASVDTIQWLNERTDSNTGFFAIRFELLQIGDPPVAPLFTVVERPSRWKEVTGDLDDTEREHRRFWSGFEDRLEERQLSDYSQGNSSLSASYRIQKDFEGAYIRLASTVHGRIECALRIVDESGNLGGLDPEQVEFDLRESVDDISTEELTQSDTQNLEWSRRPDAKFDRITLEYEGAADRSEEDDWIRYHDWLIDATLLFEEVFEGRFRS